MGDGFIFDDSRLRKDGETYLAARLGGMDCLLTFFPPDAEPAGRAALHGVETVLKVEGREVGVKLSPATYDNVLAFDRYVAPEPRLVALNKIGVQSGLGTGNRVIVAWDDGSGLGHAGVLGVFPGIFEAIVETGAANWFIQQSIVRELIPEGVDAEHYLGLGHTGGYGPRELLRAGLFAYIALGGYTRSDQPFGADADHAIVTGENEEELAESLWLNKTAIIESRDYTKFTIDVSALFGFPVTLGDEDRARLRAAFAGRTFVVPNIKAGGPGFTYTFAEEEIAALGEKYWRACQVHKALYELVAELKGNTPFDYELSLDETPQPTEPRELLFYLVTLEEVMGLPRGGVASAAPSFGFKKRTDYGGNIERDLKPQVNECASILAAFDMVLCFHSGSGLGVDTGKGPGVDEALAEATGGRLQLKVSGIFQEILWRVLAESEVPAERALFEEAWDEIRKVVGVLGAVYDRLIAGRAMEEAEALLADESRLIEIGREWGVGHEAARLVKQILAYGFGQAELAKQLLATADAGHKSPTDDFFRHFAYLVFRPLRVKIYGTLTAESWQRYTEAVADYTRMRIRGLGLGRQ